MKWNKLRNKKEVPQIHYSFFNLTFLLNFIWLTHCAGSEEEERESRRLGSKPNPIGTQVKLNPVGTKHQTHFNSISVIILVKCQKTRMAEIKKSSPPLQDPVRPSFAFSSLAAPRFSSWETWTLPSPPPSTPSILTTLLPILSGDQYKHLPFCWWWPAQPSIKSK